MADLKSGAIARVPGTTAFLTRSTQKVSKLIIDQARFVGTLTRYVIALSIVFEPVPRILEGAMESIGEGLWRVTARFGFLAMTRP